MNQMNMNVEVNEAVSETKELGFVKVAEASEIPIGQMRLVKLGDKEILIANVDGSYHAMGGRCTHAGADLSKGSLDGNIIICPKHKAKFDVTTGKVVYRPKYWRWELKLDDEPSYEVRVEGTSIFVKY